MQHSYDNPFIAPARNKRNPFNFAGQYGQPSGFAPSHSAMFSAQSLANGYNGPTLPAMPRNNASYNSYNLPLLPPIQVQDRPSYNGQNLAHNLHPMEPSKMQESVKEPKATGGVSAHLDYEMQQMTDFVAETAQGMYGLYSSKLFLADIDMLRSVQPNSPVPPAFRKFVSQILTSTRLPCSTILLGMYYLASRMNMLSMNRVYKASKAQVYHMLTIALLLGSKFLDDNTFQNRSWAEVTGLSVTELNSLEMEWLSAIGWKLHCDPAEDQGFMAWRGHWEAFKAKAVMAQVTMRPPPIDTNIPRADPHRSLYSPGPRLHPLQWMKQETPVNAEERSRMYMTPYQYDPFAWHPLVSSNDSSPPSAPETGPNTPEFYGGNGQWSGPMSGNGYGFYQPAPPPPPSRNLASYQPFGSQDIWQPHGQPCTCADCVRLHKPWYPAGAFRPLTVVG